MMTMLLLLLASGEQVVARVVAWWPVATQAKAFSKSLHLLSDLILLP